jgi:predicted CXXCH cytochrome family protein
VRACGSALALLVLIIAIACSVDQRHRVLTFFFEGVPAPGSRPARAPRMDAFLPPPRRQGISPFESVEYFLSVHAPYEEGVCGECHEIEAHAQTVLPDHVQCLRCHGEQAVSERWDHGPAALGVCTTCHDPHVSQFPHLEVAPQPALCTSCHATAEVFALPAHVGRETARCSECHDPHRLGPPRSLAQPPASPEAS